MNALLRRFGISAGRERPGDNLLPALEDASTYRQAEGCDVGLNRRRAGVRPEGCDDDVEAFSGG